ncbi:MAG: HdaA/DnaA family protein [Stellaceae bacterium]
MSGEQLPLGLPHRPAFGRTDFIVAPVNADAFGWIERWPDWPQPVLALSGPAGAGKSHLARIWRTRAEARAIAPAAFEAAELPALLGDAGAVLVDGADRAPERHLLHLVNMMAERAGHLLLVARAPPAHWGIRLADLDSRLRAMPTVAIAAPDEEFLAALLVKLFADRGLTASDELARFMARRLERSFAAAEAAVAALDKAALAGNRRLAVPLARSVFGWRDADGASRDDPDPVV